MTSRVCGRRSSPIQIRRRHTHSLLSAGQERWRIPWKWMCFVSVSDDVLVSHMLLVSSSSASANQAWTTSGRLHSSHFDQHHLYCHIWLVKFEAKQWFAGDVMIVTVHHFATIVHLHDVTLYNKTTPGNSEASWNVIEFMYEREWAAAKPLLAPSNWQCWVNSDCGTWWVLMRNICCNSVLWWMRQKDLESPWGFNIFVALHSTKMAGVKVFWTLNPRLY